ncbi:MAG: cell division protein SepF [Anaerovorax sp.]
MGIISKLKEIAGIEEIDDEDIREEEIKAAEAKMERKTVEPKSSFTSAPTRSESKVTPIPSRPVNPNTNPFKLVVTEPKSFDECPKLVDNLKARKPVILNLEKIETDTARKIFDFLSGATYALNGNVQKVANNIFVFAPENVDIMSSAEHKGVEFNGNSKNIWR